jgi:hypothetical protein
MTNRPTLSGSGIPRASDAGVGPESACEPTSGTVLAGCADTGAGSVAAMSADGVRENEFPQRMQRAVRPINDLSTEDDRPQLGH